MRIVGSFCIRVFNTTAVWAYNLIMVTRTLRVASIHVNHEVSKLIKSLWASRLLTVKLFRVGSFVGLSKIPCDNTRMSLFADFIASTASIFTDHDSPVLSFEFTFELLWSIDPSHRI
jgi:hypothetical protein